MPLMERPVAFGSINFLPGFPSLSVFGCNPWKRDMKAGACANPPSTIGREKAALPATVAMTQAMLEAGVGPDSFISDIQRGVMPAALAGLGAGSDGSIMHHNRARGGIHALGANDNGWEHHHGNEGGGGCGCGGTCGGRGGGLSGLSESFTALTSDPMGFLQDNALAIAIGAAVVFMLKRK